MNIDVLGFHFEVPGIWGGYVGVDIFFVITPRALAPMGTLSMIRPQHLRNGKQRAAGRYKRCASTDS